MKRIIDHHLLAWKQHAYRKPLILRGARQVGKTHAVRALGKTFTNFVELNFEDIDILEITRIFKQDLDPQRIVRDLELLLDVTIVPGQTLLFFDEIQVLPRAVTALRYFYEKMPALHVIAAGSLLDFALEEVGVPVGRVMFLHMYPLSFIEFLYACNHDILAQEILVHDIAQPLSEGAHQKALRLVGEYLAIGGMPEVVDRWRSARDPRLCFQIHHTLLNAYRQDFAKYAKSFQIKYLEALFEAVPRQMGTKFKYSALEGDYRKRELAPGLDLLCTAGITHRVMHSAGNGVPLGAEVDFSDFKALFLDVGLSQALLGFDVKAWFLTPEQELVNKGAIVEAFIGQEMLALAPPEQKASLFYWRRHAAGSSAEIDYLLQRESLVVPIEVKGGLGSTLKSMHLFLESHPHAPYGIRFSTHNYQRHEKVWSYPLYAVAHVLLSSSQEGCGVHYDALLRK